MDLSEANLGGADLTGADLSFAVLTEADLHGACLSNANLTNAVLYRANLREANLAGANLETADLNYADLNSASLVGAKLGLGCTDLSGADLRNADLEGVDLNAVCLGNELGDAANLAGARLGETELPRVGEHFGLGLLTSYGIEAASIARPELLQEYVALAFEFVHSQRSRWDRGFPNLFAMALQRIKLLRALYAGQAPPTQLIEVVQNVTAELLAYLKRHPKAIYQIKPRQFEELIAEILANHDWQVHLTPATKDGGYDIFAISRDIKPGIRSSWIIECKKYRLENKVGVDIVRALYGVKTHLKVANALLATTSHFTKGAKDFKASRYDIELKDYEAILEWINEYRPNPNGRLYIKDDQLVLPGET